MNDVGIDVAERHVLSLSARLREELDALGFDVVSHADAPSGITTFRTSSELAADETVLGGLLDERVLVSIRYTSGVGGIRVSTHFYNDERDLDVLVSALRRLRQPTGGRM